MSANGGVIDVDLIINNKYEQGLRKFESDSKQSGESAGNKLREEFERKPAMAKLKTQADEAGVKDFKKLLDSLPKDKQTELLAKANKGEAINFKKVISEIPKDHTTEIVAQAKEAGIDNFEKLLKRLPKDKRVELFAKAEKGEAINFEKLLREIPPKKVSTIELNDNATSGLHSIKEQAEQVTDRFSKLKQIAIGTFLGSTIASGVRTVTGFISGLGQEALNSSDALEKFKSTMQLGGFDNKEIDEARKKVKKYADDTVYDLNTVSNTTAQLAANGIKDYTGLTEAAGNLNAQAGGNAETFKSVAMVMTQTAGAGKLTTENWNQLADAIPGASGVLQKAMKENGAFTGKFRDAMENGQISADEFNDALIKLGSNDAAKKAATSTSTFEGAWGSLEANVVSGLDKIIDKIGKNHLTGIINSLSGVATKSFDTLATGVSKVVDYIDKHQSSIKGIVGSFKTIAGIIGATVWKTFSSIVYDIADMFGLVDKKGKQASDPLKTIDDVLKNIANHKEAIENVTKAILAFMAVKKAAEFVGMLKNINTQLKIMEGFKGVTGVLGGGKTSAAKTVTSGVAKTAGTTAIATAGSSLAGSGAVSGIASVAAAAAPIAAIVAGVAAIGFAFYEAYKHIKPFRNAVNDLAKSINDDVVKPISKGFAYIGDSISVAWKGFSNSFGKGFKSAFKDLPILFRPFDDMKKVIKGTADDVAKLFSPMGKKGGVIDAITTQLNKIGDWFGAHQKQIETFGKVAGKAFGYIVIAIQGALLFLTKVFASTIVPLAKGIIGAFSSAFKVIGNLLGVFGNAFKLVGNLITGHFKEAFKNLLGIFGGLGSALKNSLKGVWSIISGVFKAGVKAIDSIIEQVFGTKKNPIERFFKAIPKVASDAFKAVVKAMSGAIGGITKVVSGAFKSISKAFSKGWSSIAKNTSSATKNIVKTIGSVFSSAGKTVSKTWSSIAKGTSKTFNGILKDIKSIGKNISKAFKDIFNGMIKVGEWFVKTETKNLKAFFNFFVKLWNDLKKSIADIAKKMWNAVGDSTNDFIKWFKKTWNKLFDFYKDAWNDIRKDVLKISNKLWESITDNVNKFVKGFKKTWNNVKDFFGDTFENLKKIGSNGINSLKDNLNDVLGKIGNKFKDTWNGVKSGFKSFWNGMKEMAADGINLVIKPLNWGIGGINGLIHSFGGSKSAIGKIPEVHFATGTGIFGGRKAINRPTLATLNDGNDSPQTGNKEMLIHPSGQTEVVQGQNSKRLLQPGTEVLNATETRMYHQMIGVDRFANGTGFWSKLWGGAKNVGGKVADVAGDAWNGAKNIAGATWDGLKDGADKFTKMFKFITNAVAHPIKTLESVFNPSTKGLTGAFKSIGSGVFDKSKDQAAKWWKELWSMAKDSGEGSAGGSSSELLNRAIKYGTGKPYVWGAEGPDSFDCSGLVMYTLKQMGKSFPHYSGSQYSASTPVSKPSVGDLVFFGGGGSEHVGIYSGGGKMFSAQSPDSHPNIGYAKISNWNHGLASSPYRRVPGLANKSDDKSDNVKASNSIQSLIKSQVGGMFNWIGKNIAPLNDDEGDSGSSPMPNGSHKHWLSQAGISGDFNKWNYIINHESGWNPKAKNPSSDAYGIGQALPPSKMAKFGGDYMTNPITQLKWMKSYVNERYGGIDGAYDFWKSHNWYANGGKTNGIGIVGEVQGEDEWVTNPHRSTADETIIGSIKDTAQNQPNSFAARLDRVVQKAKAGINKAMPNMNVSTGGGSNVATLADGTQINLNGNLTATFEVDGNEVARKTFPFIKLMQSNDVGNIGIRTGNVSDVQR